MHLLQSHVYYKSATRGGSWCTERNQERTNEPCPRLKLRLWDSSSDMEADCDSDGMSSKVPSFRQRASHASKYSLSTRTRECNEFPAKWHSSYQLSDVLQCDVTPRLGSSRKSGKVSWTVRTHSRMTGAQGWCYGEGTKHSLSLVKKDVVCERRASIRRTELDSHLNRVVASTVLHVCEEYPKLLWKRQRITALISTSCATSDQCIHLTKRASDALPSPPGDHGFHRIPIPPLIYR